MTRGLVLVHSPLVGPRTWRAVAKLLPAPVWVPDLRPAMADGPPFQPGIADLVGRELPEDATVVLVGHSAAGPLLPGIAATLPGRVEALVYVDSSVPYPGRTWLEQAPPSRVEQRRAMNMDGLLPRWHEWFPPEATANLDADFLAELRPIPFAYFEERLSGAEWTGPAGYLLLSEGYRDQADAARERGLPVVEHLENHLAMLTSPAAVASALDRLLAEIRR